MSQRKTLVYISENEDDEPIISGVFYFSTNVNKRARMIRHPVESGGYVFDNKVIEPIKVTVSCESYALPGRREFEALRTKLNEMWRNRTFNFYSVTTTEDSYDNMSLVGCSHRANAEKPDALDFNLEFEEVLLGSSTPAVPQNAEHATTVG